MNAMSGEVAAVVVAAGRGVRAGGAAPKQYRQMRGAPVIRRALSLFVDHPQVTCVQPVIHGDDAATFAEATAASATAAGSLAVLAIGGLAVGFLVIGRLIIREMLIQQIHLHRLKIDQLEVEDLRVSKLTVLDEQRFGDRSQK